MVNDPSVRAYVVWVPILDSDKDAPDAKTLALVPDRRALHFWDAEGVLPALFPRTLRLPAGCPAWDVYLLYPRGMKWGKDPPKPAYWQHQLTPVTTAPPLDGKALASRLKKVLAMTRLQKPR